MMMMPPRQNKQLAAKSAVDNFFGNGPHEHGELVGNGTGASELTYFAFRLWFGTWCVSCPVSVMFGGVKLGPSPSLFVLPSSTGKAWSSMRIVVKRGPLILHHKLERVVIKWWS